MKNREIIEFIDRFCAHDEELDTISNADLAYAILAHGYLYIKPGKPTKKFMQRVVESLKSGMVNGVNNYLENMEYSTFPLDKRIHISMAETVLQVVREEFDKKYFKKQSILLDPDEVCDDALLDKYLNLMNEEQLHTFMNNISYCRAYYVAFSNCEIESIIMDELHEHCYTVNPTLPEKAYGLDYLRFVEKNPCYMFDCLSKEEIINAIKREIVWDKSLAGHMARVLYNTGSINSIEPYINLIGSYARTFGGDIYKPDIFYETLYLI